MRGRSADECREKAEACRQLADSVESSARAEVLRDLARTWEQIADSVERYGRQRHEFENRPLRNSK